MSYLSNFVKLAAVLSAALSAAVVITPLPALAGWVQMGVAVDRTRIYVESNSIIRKGEYASYIRGDFYATPQENGAKSSVMSEIVDCKSGAAKLQRAIDYNAGQSVVADDRYGPNEGIGQVPLPRSPGAAIQKYVCSR